MSENTNPKQTLTDRYIWAVQRSLPERQRADIDRELRGSIADAVDAKIESGVEPAAAEHEAISELGDPYRLASSYADRPLYLIGPAVFPDYMRLLRILFAVVLPIAFACVLLGQILSHHNPGQVIGGTVGITIALIAHLAFWPTLVFALIERSPQKLDLKWTPERLAPIPVVGAIKLSDTIAGVFWYVVLIVGVYWALHFSLDGATLLRPEIITFWTYYFIGFALAAGAFEIVLYRLRNWSIPLLIVKFVLVTAYIVPTVWLLTRVSEAFLKHANIWPTFAPSGPGTIVLIFVLIVLAAVDLGVAITRTVRARRAPMPRAR
jgi:hypothetical protein